MQIKLLHKLQQTIVDVEPSLSVRDLKVQNLIVLCRADDTALKRDDVFQVQAAEWSDIPMNLLKLL